MTFLSWRESYSVDFPQIDTEHRGLLDLVNEFYDKSTGGDPHPNSTNVLSKLVAYAEEHFKHEEALMESNAYPRLEAHREQHATLFMAIFKLNERFAANPVTLDSSTQNFLKHWLVDHLLKDDMDFRDFRINQAAQAERAIQKAAEKNSEKEPKASDAKTTSA